MQETTSRKPDAPRPGQAVDPPKFGRLERDLFGRKAFLVCGGPSLIGFDFERLRGRLVCVVNSSYLAVPWADMLVFTDPRWYGWNDEDRPPDKRHGHRWRPEFWRFKGLKVSVARYVEHPEIVRLQRLPHMGLSRDPAACVVASTTAIAAINAMTLRGVDGIGLLGFDGRTSPDGTTWHHDPHPADWERIDGCFQAHGADMRRIKPELDDLGVEVLNLNRLSAHRMFPFADLDEVLGRWPC